MKDELQDYKDRHIFWTETSVTQLSNVNNLLLTISTGFLAFCFDKRSIQSNKKVSVKIEDEDSSQRKKRMANIKGLEDSLMKIESSVDRVSTKRSRTEAEQ